MTQGVDMLELMRRTYWRLKERDLRIVLDEQVHGVQRYVIPAAQYDRLKAAGEDMTAFVRMEKLRTGS